MIALQLALGLHVLAGTFWAGSTMTFAFGVRSLPPRLFAAQMIAGLVVVGAGVFLWGQLHESAEGPQEHALTIGAVAALVAFVIQIVLVGRLVLQSMAGRIEASALRVRTLRSNRVAAALLVVAVSAMAASKFAS